MHRFRKILNDPLSFKKYYSGLPQNDQNNLLSELLIDGGVIVSNPENELVYNHTHEFDEAVMNDLEISEVSEFIERTLVLRDELAFYEVMHGEASRLLQMALIFSADFPSLPDEIKKKSQKVEIMKDRIREAPFGNFTYFMGK